MNTLFYLPKLNRFADNQWYIVHDLYTLFDTWQLDEWKRNEKNTILSDKNGKKWELYYLNGYEEDDILELVCSNNEAGLKTDRVAY